MIAPAGPKRGPLRLGIVALLLLAAFFTALPWLGCGWNPVTHVLDPAMLRICTVGFPSGIPSGARDGLPGFGGPYWGDLSVGVLYLVAAIYVAVTKRSL